MGILILIVIPPLGTTTMALVSTEIKTYKQVRSWTNQPCGADKCSTIQPISGFKILKLGPTKCPKNWAKKPHIDGFNTNDNSWPTRAFYLEKQRTASGSGLILTELEPIADIFFYLAGRQKDAQTGRELHKKTGHRVQRGHLNQNRVGTQRHPDFSSWQIQTAMLLQGSQVCKKSHLRAPSR